MSIIHANPPAVPQALVVDDNPLIRVLLSTMLSQRGFAVTEDSTAESALGRLMDRTFDLVVLDIMLSTMSGIDLCHIIRDELGLVDLPVVACTVLDDLNSIAHMRMAGFNDILFKPLDGRALDGVLEDVIVVH